MIRSPDMAPYVNEPYCHCAHIRPWHKEKGCMAFGCGCLYFRPLPNIISGLTDTRLSP